MDAVVFAGALFDTVAFVAAISHSIEFALTYVTSDICFCLCNRRYS